MATSAVPTGNSPVVDERAFYRGGASRVLTDVNRFPVCPALHTMRAPHVDSPQPQFDFAENKLPSIM
jgi:hypothetical protein